MRLIAGLEKRLAPCVGALRLRLRLKPWRRICVGSGTGNDNHPAADVVG
jgi:hypothetical protein